MISCVSASKCSVCSRFIRSIDSMFSLHFLAQVLQGTALFDIQFLNEIFVYVPILWHVAYTVDFSKLIDFKDIL